jgi:hypothetical protein
MTSQQKYSEGKFKTFLKKQKLSICYHLTNTVRLSHEPVAHAYNTRYLRG